MSHELYKRYRPKKLEEVIGQNKALASLRKFIEQDKLPHVLLLTGPSGCGKTTIARILRRHIKCSSMDYVEINTADFRGIDTIREIRKSSQLQPISGNSRLYLFDEAHKIVGGAQEAMLKLLEDTPDHVYFVLATTEPNKLLNTVIGRCTEVKLSPIGPKDMEALLLRIAKEEKLKIAEDIIDEIIEAADGSARKALVILESVSQVEGEQAQKEAIMHSTLDKDLAFSLAKALIWGKETWPDIAKMLRELEDYEPEGIRQMILGLARAALIGPKTGGPPKNPKQGAIIIEIFEEPLYNSRHPGLALKCYQAFCQK